MKFPFMAARADDPLQCTFAYAKGTMLTCVAMFDADPERCRRYFGVVPGQRCVKPDGTMYRDVHRGLHREDGFSC